MKLNKLLALLLVLVVCVGALASCDLFGGNGDGGKTVALSDAADYLFNMYKDDEGKSTQNDFNVVGKVLIGGVSFEVTWASDNALVTIKAADKANFWTVDLPEVNETEFTYKLTATIKAADGSTATKVFNRVCPVYNNEGVTNLPEAGVAYKLFFYQANKGKNYYALNTITDKYIATTTNPAEASDYYVEAEGDGFKFYTTIEGAKKYVEAYLYNAGEETNDAGETVIHWSKRIKFSDEGTVWTYKADCNAWFCTLNDGPYVLGTYQTFTTFSISDGSFMTPDSTGVSQFPANFIKSDTAVENAPVGPVEHTCADANGDYVCDIENCGEIVAPAANSTLTLAEAIKLATALKGDYTKDKYYITGTITKVDSAEWGNLYITDGETESFYVYGTYDATGDIRYDAMTEKPVEGDTVTLWGQIGCYKDVPQMKNAWLNGAPSEGGDNTDAPAIVDAPVAGTAYKFAMIQGNLENAIYYLKGGMDGYYMATTTNAAEAIDVYLEETTGGYYLYCYVGETKTYINMVVSGTHVNGAYEAAASTVYTYNTESKTIVASVNDTDYWFGTRNDKEYTTMGPCAVSYNGFYGQFYASSTTEQPGGDSDPVVPPTGDGDDTPSTSATMPYTAGVAYKLYMEQVQLGGKFYFTGLTTDKSYRLAITDWVYDAVDVYIEEVNENGVVVGFQFYFMNNGVKTYIDAILSGTYLNIALTETPTAVFTYNETFGTFVTMLDSQETYFGSYDAKNYVQASNTSYISGSNASKLGVSQYVIKFAASVDVPDVTDQIKVDYIKNHLSVQETFTADGVINLPASFDIIDGATISWTKDGVEYTAATLAITQTDADQTIVLVATVASGSVSEQVTFNVTVNAKVSIGETASADLVFSKDNRTAYSTTQAVFAANGITLTNNKGTANNLGDYAAPVRLYQGSEVIISCAGMTQIVFNVNASKYVTPLTNSLTDTANYTVTVNGNTVTLVFNAPTDSLTFTAAAQTRFDSITVTYTAA